MATLVLTIKKYYFDKILSGDKVFEYRDYKPFYINRFQKQYSHLVLHYQKGVKLIAQIVDVKLIKKPKHLKHSPYLKNNMVYQIEIKNPKILKSQKENS